MTLVRTDMTASIAALVRERRVHLEARRDMRAVFAYTYELMTERIEATLASSGYLDPAWVAEITEQFVDAYFVALDAAEAGREVPAGWKPCFDKLATRYCSALDGMLLGMIAHIVWDLPRVLVETRGEGVVASQLHDFHRMNDVLCGAIDEIQRKVSRRYDPLLAWLDHWVGRQDEYATAYGIRVARALAWYNSDRLRVPQLFEEAERSTTASTEQLMHELMRPRSWMLRAGLSVLRFASTFTRRWPSLSHATSGSPT